MRRRISAAAKKIIKRRAFILDIGLNLFSLRNMLATEQSFLDAVNALKGVGYDYFQFSGAPFDGEMDRAREQGGGRALLPYARSHAEDTRRYRRAHARTRAFRL